MKKLLLLFVISFSTTLLVAQNSRWSQTEVMLQSHFLQQPNDFKTVYDVGIGTRWNYQFTPRLSMNLGGFLNYGKYSKNEVEDGTLYIDFFKKTEIHYFVIENINQLTVETPLSLQFKLAKLGKNKVSILGSARPQFVVNSKISGFRFNEYVVMNDNLTDENYNIFNDALLNLGFSIVRPIYEQHNILLEFGYEYSTTTMSNGLFIRSGIDF